MLADELLVKRAELSLKSQELIRNIKELKRIEEEEYELSQKYRVLSIQSNADTESSEYVECPMPGLGTVWCAMPKSVAEAFVSHLL